MAQLAATSDKNKLKVDASSKIFDVMAVVIVGLVALICVAPFILMLSGSLSDESKIVVNGYSLLPQDFTLDAYKIVFTTLGGNWQGVSRYHLCYGAGHSAWIIDNVHERIHSIPSGF